MTTAQWISDMEKAVEAIKKENARLDTGVRCSAPRVRKQLKELSVLCRSGRQEALARGKAIPKRPVKPRAAKEKAPEAAAEPEKAVAQA